MKILSDDAIHSKFLLNLPVHIEGIGNFYAPMLTDIVDLTEEYYNMALSTVFFDKSKVEEDLGEHSNFEVLLYIVNQDDYFRELFFYGITLHIDNSPLIHPTGAIFFGEFSQDSILTEEKLEYIKKLVRIANNIPEPKPEEEYKAGNEMARKLIEEIKKKRERKNKVAKQSPINLHSMMSAVGWKAQSFEFISKLTIYQLYDGFHRLRVIDNYDHNIRGIYSGTVDASKIKLSEIDWANIIK
ncbi:hypothetical protein V7128_01265 [Neobacillus vireti]|uniref:hypothetical protein n=1 Tax=Neobacillus vireti TaxID=220686 RepID=UPI003000C9D8